MQKKKVGNSLNIVLLIYRGKLGLHVREIQAMIDDDVLMKGRVL